MNNRIKEIVIVLFFAFLAIFTFRNYFLKGQVPFPANLLVSYYQPWKSYEAPVANKPMGFDNLRIFYPFRSFTIEQLKHFRIPLWNPYDFSGNVHLATYQSAVFFPLSFLFFLFPQIDAWSMIIILEPIFTSLFTYLFLRELKLSRKSAMFGAVVFAYSGYMITNWEESFMAVYSALFLPLALFSIEKIFQKIQKKYFLILLGSLVFSILSGWFQSTLYLYFFSAGWLLFRYIDTYKRQKKALIFILLVYILSIFVACIHLIPSVEAYMYSARGTTNAKFIFDDYLASYTHLITFIAPDFFGSPATYNYFEGRGFYYEKIIFIGLVPLIFAIYAMLYFRKYTSEKKFFTCAFIICLSLGFSLPTSWFILYYLRLPFISTILPTRIFFLSTFSLSVLSAIGIETYLHEKKSKILIFILVCIGIVIVGSSAYAFSVYFKFPQDELYKNYIVSLKNMVVPGLIFIAMAVVLVAGQVFRFSKKTYFSIFFLIAIGSIMYSTNKYLYFSARQFVFPKVPVLKKIQEVSGNDRFWGYNNGRLESNFGTYYHLYSPEGYDSIYISRYGELIAAAANKGRYVQEVPRTDAKFVTNDYEAGIDANFYRARLMQLLDVRYILENKNDVIGLTNRKLNNFQQIWEDNLYRIYKYKDAYPHTFLVNDYKIIQSKQKILNVIFNPQFDLRHSIILEEKPAGFQKSGNFFGTAKIVNYTPNVINIKTTSRSSALLFLSDNYFPGWNAYIDSIKTKIYRADYSFRGVVVPKGTHIITFLYQPMSFIWGAAISTLSLLLIPIIFWLFRFVKFLPN